MLANNTSYEDLFTTCQITPENHRLFLGSLLNMQLTSRNPFSRQFFSKIYWPTPFNIHFDFRPALSHNFRENIPIHRPWPSAGGTLKEKRRPGALVFASRKPHFWKFGYYYSHSLVPFSCRTPGGNK